MPNRFRQRLASFFGVVVTAVAVIITGMASPTQVLAQGTDVACTPLNSPRSSYDGKPCCFGSVDQAGICVASTVTQPPGSCSAVGQRPTDTGKQCCSGLIQAAGVCVNNSNNSTIPAIKDANEANKAFSTENQVSSTPVGFKFNDTFWVHMAKMLGGPASGVEEYDQTGGSITTDKGLTGTMLGYIGNMYDYPPATGGRYVADLMNDLKMGGAQPAYAQGVGFGSLDPILSTWKVMRNIAYMFFVLIFIAIGFMIMFRQKISSQAVITAQQALPSIIVALITVTFSYAIAGFLIDIMYLAMYLIAGLFGKPELIQGNAFQLAGYLIGSNAAGQTFNEVHNFVSTTLNFGVVADIVALLPSLAALVIVLLLIAFNSFRLFIALLRCYVEIILNIAFAPAILMFGAIPGSKAFNNWFRNLIGNLAVFPGILVILVVFSVLRENVEASNQPGFSPPYMGGGSSATALPFLAGLAMILALPQAVEEIKKAMGVKEGGLFQNLVQAGMKNAMSQRRTGMGASMAILGGGAGALIGGGLGAINGTGFRGGLARGALYGGVGMPAALAAGPKLFKGATGTLLQQASDIAAEDSLNAVADRFRVVQAVRDRVRRLEGSRRTSTTAKTAPQTTTENVMNRAPGNETFGG